LLAAAGGRRDLRRPPGLEQARRRGRDPLRHADVLLRLRPAPPAQGGVSRRITSRKGAKTQRKRKEGARRGGQQGNLLLPMFSSSLLCAFASLRETLLFGPQPGVFTARWVSPRVSMKGNRSSRPGTPTGNGEGRRRRNSKKSSRRSAPAGMDRVIVLPLRRMRISFAFPPCPSCRFFCANRRGPPTPPPPFPRVTAPAPQTPRLAPPPAHP